MSPISTWQFQRLAPDQFDAAYDLVITAATWLRQRNLPTWLIPREAYYERHIAGDNYGLLADGDLCAVVTLAHYRPAHWQQSIVHQDFIWLATLASTRTQTPHSYGQILLQLAEQYLTTRHTPAIYLDCYYGNGKLPQYYARLGYEWLERREFVFEDHSRHDSVLMRKILTPR